MKKGFTLVELLAVIVILSIIVLITIPIIRNVIDNSKIGALKDSAYGILSAAELYYSQAEVPQTTVDLTSGLIKFKGKIDSGKVMFNEKQTQILIVKDNICAYKPFDLKIVKTGKVENGICIINGLQINIDDSTIVEQSLLINVKSYLDDKFKEKDGTKNKVAVITDKEYFGYVLSSFEPDDKTKLWISLSDRKDTILDLETINISLGGVYQFIDDKWIQIDSYLFNDEWINLTFSIDDWKILAAEAGLNAKNYTSIKTFVNDKNAMNKLMNSEPAIIYMIDSISSDTTNIIDAITSSTVAMEEFSNSKYALELVANNETWFNKIKKSEHYNDYAQYLLNSNALTNLEKYNYVYPAYIYKNGAFTTLLNPVSGYGYGFNNNCSMSHSATTGSSYITVALQSCPNDCASQTYGSSSKINIDKYVNMGVEVSSFSGTIYASAGFCASSPSDKNSQNSYSVDLNSTGNLYVDISNVTGSFYPMIRFESCSGGAQYNAKVNISRWWIQ